MYQDVFVKGGFHVRTTRSSRTSNTHAWTTDSEWAKKGNIEIGGQLLCKMAQARAIARDKHFGELSAKSQLDSVDNTYILKIKIIEWRPNKCLNASRGLLFGKDS